MDEFIALVTEMRAAQKRYFMDRSYDHLQAAKKLEHQVDVWLKQHSEQVEQPLLFQVCGGGK